MKKKIIATVMSLTLLFGVCGTGTVSAKTQEKTKIQEKNCIQLDVNVEEKTVFGTGSFPETNCSEVYVAEMGKKDNGYVYTLVLAYDGNADVALEKEKLSENTEFEIENIKENTYYTNNSEMSLSEETVFLKVGQTKEISIKELNLREKSEKDYLIAMSLNRKVSESEQSILDKFAKYDICRMVSFNEAKQEGYLPEKFQGWNSGFVGWTDENTLQRCVETVDALVKVDFVNAIAIFAVDAETDLKSEYENWIISDDEIASISLKGGELYAGSTDKLKNQTADVTGVIPGEAVLKVERCDNGMPAKKECLINVYLPGDVNLNNKIEAEDALEALKDVANMEELDELASRAADVDENGVIAAEDALGILKSVARLPRD